MTAPKAAVPRPATMEKEKLWANTATWWIFVSGEKSIDPAHPSVLPPSPRYHHVDALPYAQHINATVQWNEGQDKN